MSKRSREDRAYMAWIRRWPCVVVVALQDNPTSRAVLVEAGQCDGSVEFCHLEHAGMGGRYVPVFGNGFPACGRHHRDINVGFHGLGVESFQLLYGVQLVAVCLRLAKWREFGVPLIDESPVSGLSLMRAPGG